MEKRDLYKPTETLLTKQILTILYYEKGYTLREIGKIFGLSYEGIRWRMEKYGLKRLARAGRKAIAK